MFEIPGSDVLSVHISEDCVVGSRSAEYVRGTPRETTPVQNEEPWPGVRVQN